VSDDTPRTAGRRKNRPRSGNVPDGGAPSGTADPAPPGSPDSVPVGDPVPVPDSSTEGATKRKRRPRTGRATSPRSPAGDITPLDRAASAAPDGATALTGSDVAPPDAVPLNEPRPDDLLDAAVTSPPADVTEAAGGGIPLEAEPVTLQEPAGVLVAVTSDVAADPGPSVAPLSDDALLTVTPVEPPPAREEPGATIAEAVPVSGVAVAAAARTHALWQAVAADGLAVSLVIGLALVFYRALVFSGEIASDPLLMRLVYPYRQFLAEALRDGRLPLWNPYLFTGVPFLADPQAGALYPPNLALRWLDAPWAVTLSVVTHSVLAAAAMYAFGRISLEVGRPAALAGAVVFAFGGFMGASAVEPNVLEAAAWLPAALLAADIAYRRWLVIGVASGALVLAVQALAGELHVSLLSLLAIALLLLARVVSDLFARRPRGGGVRAAGLRMLRAVTVAAVMPLLGGLLAAPQLLPAWELLRRSLRAGGLPYSDLTAGALPAEMIVRALLPGFNEDPPRLFVAHAGILALGLAAVGLRRASFPCLFGVLVSAAGLLAALGDENPFRHALYRRAPEWAVFEHPTRALLLVSLGVSILAAAGLDALDTGRPGRAARWRRGGGAWVRRGAAVTAVVVVAAMLLPFADRIELPSRGVREIWVGIGIMALDVALLLPLLRPRRWIALLLVGVVTAELLIAGAQLPFTRTAPAAAFSVEAALAPVVRGGEVPGRVARVDGIAETDPAPAPGFERYATARAGRDRLAPNATMLDRVATLEGLRTLLLPTRDIAEALGIAGTSPEARAAGGRSRGAADVDLVTVGALTDDGQGVLGPRLGATHVLGPPRVSLHAGSADFVLGVGLELQPGAEVRLELRPERAATGLALLSDLSGGSQDGQPVAELVMTESGGTARRRTLVAGIDTGDGTRAPAGRAVELGDGGTVILSEQPLGRVAAYRLITLRNLTPAGTLRIQALSLLDERTGGSSPLLLGETLRPVAGTNPAVYEDTRTPSRATLTRRFIVEPDAAATRRNLAGLPAGTVVLDSEPDIGSIAAGGGSLEGDRVRVALYAPERVEVLVTAAAPALLVLRDTYYPGWRARLDGQPAPVLRAGGLFRAVVVPEGTHSVTFEYRPQSLRRGVLISLAAFTLLTAVSLVSLQPPWARGTRRRSPLRAFDTPERTTLD
jgi:hypothetical protein